MSDPFLSSLDGADRTNDAGNAVDACEVPDAELARRAGLPPALLDKMLEDIPRAHIEGFVLRIERRADLAVAIDRTLVSAGFHRHDPSGPGGGFHLATGLRDDGVLLLWAIKGNLDGADPLEPAAQRIMHPALAALLTEYGFTTETISDGQDDAGHLVVTGCAPAHT